MNSIEHYIDGKVFKGSSKRTGKIFNPATGEQTSEVKFATSLEIDRTATIAKKAFETWSQKLKNAIKNKDINTISLISPTTKPDRIKSIAENSTGFVYYITLRGVTGSSNLNIEEIKKNIEEVKKYSSVPTLAGFGIKSKQDAKLLADCSDGVIIGSSLVQMIEEGSEKKEFDRIGIYISEIKKAIS